MTHIIRLITPLITTLNPIEALKNPKPLPVNLQVSPKAAVRFLFNGDFVDRGTRSVPWSENEVAGFISFWELGLVGQIWEFPKIRVPFLGVLIIRILLFRVLYQGPLFSETPIWGP